MEIGGDQIETKTPSNVTLVYGAGAIGKSTLVALKAAHIHRKLGLNTRIVGADPGGAKAFAVLIDKGIAQYWPIDLWTQRSIFLTLDLASKGWWPQDITIPNSPLLPPAVEVKPCPKCGKDSGAPPLGMVLKCKSCGVEFGAGQTLESTLEPINGFDKIGLVAFESGAAFGKLLLNRLRKINPDGGRTIVDKLSDKSEDHFTISSSGQQHYLDAQNYIAQYITNARQIPVNEVIWTTLELRGKDEFNRPVYGPEFPGKALTTACIPWFTDVIHVDIVTKMNGDKPALDSNGQEITERFLYMAPHYPADTKPYGFAAKSSAPSGGGMPKILPFREPPDNVMATYDDLLTKAYKKSGEALLG